MLALGRGQLGRRRCLQAGVARQAEHVTDAVRLAPRHQLLVGKAGVGAQHDAHLAPLAANPRDDARHFLDRAGAAGDVGAPLPRQQQVPAAEGVERQIAVIVVVAVEEAAFLHAVERDVGVVEIDHDLARRALMRLDEQIDQQRIDLRRRNRSCDTSRHAASACAQDG